MDIYTYDSFVAQWGPGPAIEAGFEATCACDLRFTVAGDGPGLLSRLRLEGARGRADVVVGLDTALTADAAATGLFAPHGVTADWALPIAWDDPLFLPYDWGWFAFVHRTSFDPPQSLRDLAASDATILIQDPRSSTPGLGLLLWVEAAYGDAAGDLWGDLADNIVTVTPGWSEAYGLYLQGEADMVLSYTTSPSYHLVAEGDDTHAAAAFDEGHYLQIEVAAMLAASDQPDLARDFLRYLASADAQGLLPTTNWMYPAIEVPDGLPDGFDTFRPATSLLIPVAEVPVARQAALDVWRQALAR